MNEQEAREIINSQEQHIASLEAELKRIKTNNIAFIRKVHKLRQLQTEYFKSRSQETLRQSKSLEAEVDKYLSRCIEAINRRESDEKVELVKDLFDAIPVQDAAHQ